MAKGIIAYYFYKYIAKEEQKEIIRKKQAYDLKIIEEEKIKQYSKNDIFKQNKENEINNKQIACVKNDNFIMKIIKKILNLLKRG